MKKKEKRGKEGKKNKGNTDNNEKRCQKEQMFIEHKDNSHNTLQKVDVE